MTRSRHGDPRVSVIVPTYQRSERLRRALASVLAQTVEVLEIIVVDDASDDGTPSVVASLADPRVRYLVHDENRGLAAARNTGFEASRGAYVTFLDDDDELPPQLCRGDVPGPRRCAGRCRVHRLRRPGDRGARRSSPRLETSSHRHTPTQPRTLRTEISSGASRSADGS